jgi:hypothetical protein
MCHLDLQDLKLKCFVSSDLGIEMLPYIDEVPRVWSLQAVEMMPVPIHSYIPSKRFPADKYLREAVIISFLTAQVLTRPGLMTKTDSRPQSKFLIQLPFYIDFIHGTYVIA